ncbi:MAG: glycosyltransferase family 4 protein [Paracoccaceae bacterium]
MGGSCNADDRWGDDLCSGFGGTKKRGRGMIRVAHVKGNYGHVGGIESMLEGLMPEFAALPEVEPLVIFVSRQRDPALEARLTAHGRVRLIVLQWGGLATAPLVAWRLARVLRDEKISVVHTHDMRANLVVALARPLCATPWIAHVHGWLGATHSRLYRAFEAVDRALMRRADHVLTGSHAALAEVRAAGARVASVVPNAVPLPPLPDQAAARRALGLTPDGVIFAVLGRLHPGKGQDLFLQALATLPRDVAWQGVIVGTGDAADSLSASVDALGLGDRVRFAGFVASTVEWIAASDVIAVPSRKESLPLTCLEGMAQGRAVVVSRAGDLPLVVQHDVNGLVVPIDDAVALGQAFARLLQDGPLRQRLGDAARAHIEAHHTVAVLARQMVAVEQAVADQGRRSVRS